MKPTSVPFIRFLANKITCITGLLFSTSFCLGLDKLFYDST